MDRGQIKNGKDQTESIIILSQHGLIRWASSSIHFLLGYLPAEIVGKEIFSLIYKAPPKIFKKLFEYLHQNPTNINEGLKQFLKKNGEKVALFVTINNISDLPEMSGVLVHLKLFTPKENTAGISILLDKVEIETELRKKIEQEIAAELHDNVKSTLAGVKLILDHSLKDTNKYYAELQGLSPILADLIKTVRSISHSISKKANQDFELYETLNLLIEKLRKVSVVRVVLKYDKTVENLLKNHHKVHLARIVHEQVMNVINHANATKVLISFQYKNEKIIVITRDNGKGFSPETHHEGIGLSNMYYRVNILGGNIHINSKCDEGTTISMVFPVN